MVSNTWLDISGGVIISDNVNVATVACFLYFHIIWGVTSPILDKK